MKKITKIGLIVIIIAILAIIYQFYPRNLDKSEENNIKIVENENNNDDLSENNEIQEN